MRDLISRQTAIDALAEWEATREWDDWCYDHKNEAEKYHIVAPSAVAKALPSAQPERKTATWLIRKWGADAKCSNCGKTFKDVYDMDNHDRNCRFCGSEMIGVRGVEA